MKGLLTDQPLAELVREIGTKGLSGTLRLDYDRAKTVVYFEDGQVIFAASNLRSLRLREYLRKRKVVSEKELASMGDISDLKLAGLLCGIGKLQQANVDALFATIVSDTLLVALLWTDGHWHFDERAHLNEPIRVSVDTSNLLREAAHRMPLKFVSTRFRNPKEVITRTPATPTGNSFTPSETFVLSRLDVPVTLEELVALSGLRDLDAYRLIYGLTLSGHLQREYWHHAFRTPAPKAVKVKPETEVTPETVARIPESTDEEEVEDFLERLNKATDYYEVIELPPTAEANAIKEAYYTLARRYHPDRFHFQSGTPLHARISSAFARITQAYETLTDPKARATYDATLKRTRKFAEAASKASKNVDATPKTESDAQTAGEAEEHFQEGFSALQIGQVSAAVTHLGIASRLVPNDARYRANYGRALAATEATRRLAESELMEAVKLEPSNANYRTLLAELYFDLKFYRRAQAELERALGLEPNNTNARALLKKLPASGKTE